MLRYHTEGPVEPTPVPTFHAGDDVLLAEGTYQGTTGVFLTLRADPKWADIREGNSQIRSHPVEWLQLAHRNLQQGGKTTPMGRA
jgi:hypothetical protein